jgi:hypothetical protein
MNDRRFGRKVRRMARIKTWHGEMSEYDRDRIIKGSHDNATVKRWRAKLEQPVYGAPWVGPGASQGIDWTTVWEWFKANWPAILKILLTLLVFLGDNPDEDSTSSDPSDSPNESRSIYEDWEQSNSVRDGPSIYSGGQR